MIYTKHTWETGETITAEKLNNIEDGIEKSQIELIKINGDTPIEKTFSANSTTGAGVFFPTKADGSPQTLYDLVGDKTILGYKLFVYSSDNYNNHRTKATLTGELYGYPIIGSLQPGPVIELKTKEQKERNSYLTIEFYHAYGFEETLLIDVYLLVM